MRAPQSGSLTLQVACAAVHVAAHRGKSGHRTAASSCATADASSRARRRRGPVLRVRALAAGQHAQPQRLDRRDGRARVDIAAGPGPTPGTKYLYIGDIGDNRGRRDEMVVYRVAEPDTNKPASTKRKTSPSVPSEAIRLRYPDGSHDAETLLVHPATGNIYIVTKIPFSNPGIYEAKAPLTSGRIITLTRVGTLEVPSLMGGIIPEARFRPMDAA